MVNERYICSNSMILASWWGKVILDRDRDRVAAFFTSSDRPKEPPMMKDIWLVPLMADWLKAWASSSLVSSLPSMHSAIILEPACIFDNIFLPSVSSPIMT